MVESWEDMNLILPRAAKQQLYELLMQSFMLVKLIMQV